MRRENGKGGIMPKGKPSNATAGARPKTGFEKGHAKPEAGARKPAPKSSKK
jgi:hypothetical protein